MIGLGGQGWALEDTITHGWESGSWTSGDRITGACGDISSSQSRSARDCCKRRLSPHTLGSSASWFIQRLCSHYNLSLFTAHCNCRSFAHLNWNRFNKDNLSAPGNWPVASKHYFLHKSRCIMVGLCCSSLQTKVSSLHPTEGQRSDTTVQLSLF